MVQSKITLLENHLEIVEEWNHRLDDLIKNVSQWGEEAGWSTRRVEKKMKDSEVGEFLADALLLQLDTTRILLEPIARKSPGADGVVDLYLLPAYDDVASIYWENNGWKLHYMFPESPAMRKLRDTEAKVMSKESLLHVLNEMQKHAS